MCLGSFAEEHDAREPGACVPPHVHAEEVVSPRHFLDTS